MIYRCINCNFIFLYEDYKDNFFCSKNCRSTFDIIFYEIKKMKIN